MKVAGTAGAGAAVPALATGATPASRPAAASGAKAAGTSAPPSADGLLLRHQSPPVSQPEPAVRPAPPERQMEVAAEPTQRSAMLLAAAAIVALLLAGAGAYYLFGRTPDAAATPTRTAAVGSGDSGKTAGPTQVEARPTSSGAPSSATVTPAPVSAPASPPARSPAPVPPASSPGARTDPWAAVHQFSRDARYDRALAAIEQVKGVPQALMQEERNRVMENARRYTLAARRSAEDMRLTKTPQYVLGTNRQEQADTDRTAGRLKPAVSGYMAARTHFLQAFSDSGKEAPAVVATPPAVPEPAPANPAPESEHGRAAVDGGPLDLVER